MAAYCNTAVQAQPRAEEEKREKKTFFSVELDRITPTRAGPGFEPGFFSFARTNRRACYLCLERLAFQCALQLHSICIVFISYVLLMCIYLPVSSGTGVRKLHILRASEVGHCRRLLHTTNEFESQSVHE